MKHYVLVELVLATESNSKACYDLRWWRKSNFQSLHPNEPNYTQAEAVDLPSVPIKMGFNFKSIDISWCIQMSLQ